MKVVYPTTTTLFGGRCRIAFPDVPEASAEAESFEAAIALASRRLAAVLHASLETQGEMPLPSAPVRRQQAVAPPALAAAKLLLLQAMHEQGVTNVALAARLGTVEGTVRRLLDLGQRSHIGAVEAALGLLGKRLVVEAWPALR